MPKQALILIRENPIRAAFCEAFSAGGLSTRVATTIGDVLSELLKHTHAAVVIDLECVTEGAEVLRDLRKGKGGENTTVFVLVSDRNAMRPAYEYGADFVLRKPVTPEKIASSLKVMDELRANITLARRLFALRPAAE
jgi:DNA-binding response OmpR family regulator